jgi:hypothetical protein
MQGLSCSRHRYNPSPSFTLLYGVGFIFLLLLTFESLVLCLSIYDFFLRTPYWG